MASGSPMRQGMEEATHAYSDEMQKRFNRASAGDGTWPALKKSTVKAKQRKTLFADRILYVTGALFGSLSIGGANNIYEVLPDRVRYGTRDRVAAMHHHGRGKLPKREILVPLTADALQRCTDPIAAAWRKVINACCNDS